MFIVMHPDFIFLITVTLRSGQESTNSVSLRSVSNSPPLECSLINYVTHNVGLVHKGYNY